MNREQLDRQCGRDIPAGEVLFRQGDEGEHMYVIQSGRVAIIREAGGLETVLAVLPPGEFFGEMATLNGAPRSATARVVEDARLLAIDSNTLASMIRGSGEIAARLIGRLAARLDRANRQIDMLLFRDPVIRVVHALRQHAETDGTPAAEGIRVNLAPLDLGQRVNLSAEEVTQALGDLTQAGLLSRCDDGSFVLAQAGKLLEFLESIELRERAARAG